MKTEVKASELVHVYVPESAVSAIELATELSVSGYSDSQDPLDTGNEITDKQIRILQANTRPLIQGNNNVTSSPNNEFQFNISNLVSDNNSVHQTRPDGDPLALDNDDDVQDNSTRPVNPEKDLLATVNAVGLVDRNESSALQVNLPGDLVHIKTEIIDDIVEEYEPHEYFFKTENDDFGEVNIKNEFDRYMNDESSAHKSYDISHVSQKLNGIEHGTENSDFSTVCNDLFQKTSINLRSHNQNAVSLCQSSLSGRRSRLAKRNLPENKAEKNNNEPGLLPKRKRSQPVEINIEGTLKSIWDDKCLGGNKKLDRNSGQSYNIIIHGPRLGKYCGCARSNTCFEMVNEVQRKHIFDSYKKLTSKKDRESYFCNLITMDSSDGSDDGLKCKVLVTSESKTQEVQICRKAFINIHNLTDVQFQKICEKRGVPSVPAQVRGVINNHIRKFRTRQSRYSFRMNPEKKYLPETLSRNTMHGMFQEESNMDVPLTTYSKFLNLTGLGGFLCGSYIPQSGTCSFCGELDELEKRNNTRRTADYKLREDLLQKRRDHLKKVNVFHELRGKYSRKCRTGGVIFVSFDFMRDLPLPHLGTNDTYYCRQLWYRVFGVHDLENDSASMYVYNETVAQKGVNEVASLLFDYLMKKKNSSDNLIIISDGCANQNKNFVIICFFYLLVHSFRMFRKITHIFPYRGHSFLPNEVDFKTIKMEKSAKTVETAADWNRVIKNCRNSLSPFEVVEVSQDKIFDVKSCVERYFKRPSDTKYNDMKSLRMYQIHSVYEDVRIKTSYSESWNFLPVRNGIPLPETPSFEKLRDEPIPIKKNKWADIEKLLHFLKPENRSFYQLLRDSASISTDESEESMEESDNSSGEE